MANDGKKRKRLSTRTSGNHDAKKLRTTVYFSPEASQRLGIHAQMTRRPASEVLEELINTHLRRFVVQDRSPAGEAEAPADPS